MNTMSRKTVPLRAVFDKEKWEAEQKAKKVQRQREKKERFLQTMFQPSLRVKPKSQVPTLFD